MILNNKIKLLIGLALVAFSFVCIFAIFYFLGQVNEKNEKRIASLEVKLTNLIAVKSKIQIEGDAYERVYQGPVSLDDLLDRSETLYKLGERRRKDGFLWIDRKTGTGMITLGALHGLKKNDYVTVYNNKNEPIAAMIVTTPFDVISYVEPYQKTFDNFPNDYYHVGIEE